MGPLRAQAVSVSAAPVTAVFTASVPSGGPEIILLYEQGIAEMCPISCHYRLNSRKQQQLRSFSRIYYSLFLLAIHLNVFSVSELRALPSRLQAFSVTTAQLVGACGLWTIVPGKRAPFASAHEEMNTNKTLCRGNINGGL
ncbi:hypothetical protein NDU88_006331 [Pleurodeles waltl]|uniref:Uncharacterized protein n=1 Tax=Pleurodeles waltl TaxID=8319 RepID=A0AAV7X180_PLEWA|nr:hypothetical protein NDU88_006331 [Pleurodeles waltl]